jgi:hypothetical protein
MRNFVLSVFPLIDSASSSFFAAHKCLARVFWLYLAFCSDSVGAKKDSIGNFSSDDYRAGFAYGQTSRQRR